MTKKSNEAGAKNLAKWKAENPSGGNLKHGGWSRHFRKRYGDKRTREGKRLDGAINALVEDLGGSESVSAAQRLLLDNIRSKLIVLFQISKFVDRQPDIIDKNTGKLLSCLAHNFTSYSEALRRDLEALVKLSNNPKPPSLEDYIRTTYGSKDKS